MKIKHLVLIIFLFLLSSCGLVPYNAYDGPARPDANLAKLKATYNASDAYFGFTTFLSIDGKPSRPFAQIVMLLPGEHTLTGNCQFLSAGSGIAKFTVKHKFSAGKNYEIICYDANGHASAAIRKKDN